MLAKMNHRIESYLYRKGFTMPEIRSMVRNQVWWLLASVLGVLAVSGFSGWTLGFVCGAVLAVLNFWTLAKVAPQIMHIRKGAVAPLLFQFYGRLVLTGLALFVLIAYAAVPVVSLVSGLGVVVANVVSWGAFYAKWQKVKEA